MTEGFRPRVGARHEPQHGIDRHDGGTAITDQRQGQADNGHNTDAHANIDGHLEDQRGSCTKADQTAHIILTADTYKDTAGNNGKFQQHHEHAAEKAQFLADGGEHIVCMLGEETAALGTVAVEQALSGQTAAG